MMFYVGIGVLCAVFRKLIKTNEILANFYTIFNSLKQSISRKVVVGNRLVGGAVIEEA